MASQNARIGEVAFKVDGPQRIAGTQHELWVLELPDGSRVIVREEEHGLPTGPCAHQPPRNVDVWHYNIEYQVPVGNRGNKRQVFNLHMAAWRDGSNTCFSCWNINPSRCIVSNCVNGDEMDRIQDTIRDVAQSVLDALQFAAEMSWAVAMAIAAAILWVLSQVFARESYA